MHESATGSRFWCRPTEAGDEAFLRALEADRWEVSPDDPLADLQFRARREGYRSVFPDAEDRLVIVGEKPAGRLLMATRPAAHHVIDVALLARYRGRRIGTALMREAQAAAAVAGVPVEVTVLASAPRLVRWYERLGFVPVSSGDVHVRMVWAGSRAH